MRWLLNALSTSVGRKVVMSITGLLLCGFLVAHLAGNFLLYAPDNGHSYNEYAHALHKQAALLAIAEVGLFGLFIAHIVIALQVSAENRAARKVGYAVTRSKQEGRIAMEAIRPDMWMLVTGIVVLGFLILHLMDFKFELRDKAYYTNNVAGTLKKIEPYDKAMRLLASANLITIAGYAIGSFALLAHLAHGFQSAFQSLGFNHPKYTPAIKTFGLVFAITMGVGFASFPISGALRGVFAPASTTSANSGRTMPNQSLDPVPIAAIKNREAPPSSTKKSNIEHSIILLDEPSSGTLKGVDDPRIEQRVNSKAKRELGDPN